MACKCRNVSFSKESFKLIAPVKKGDFTKGNNKYPTLTSQLLYIKCSITNLKFLIDTGSSRSVILVDPNSRDHPQNYLSAVNGSSVPTFGCKNITIDMGGPVPLNWKFCIAETLKPIIGIDFLSHFDIKIDPRRGRLIFPKHIPQSANIKSFYWFHRRFGPHAQKCRDPCSFLSNTELKPSLCNVEPPVYNLGDYQFLEAEFSEVFSVSNLRLPPKHDIVHYIETTVPPIKQRPRRLSSEKLAVLRKELSQLEELGIIGPSSSSWTPTIITTDRGAQFTSLLWTEMCQFLGSKLCHTAAFHPAANGLNERFNRNLKVALKCQSPTDLWYRNLSLVLLGLRSAIKEDMGCAAVEMALGTSIRLPGEYFENSTPVELSEENTVQPTSQYAKTLCSFMNSLRYTVPRHPKKQQTYVDHTSFPMFPSICSY